MKKEIEALNVQKRQLKQEIEGFEMPSLKDPDFDRILNKQNRVRVRLKQVNSRLLNTRPRGSRADGATEIF